MRTGSTFFALALLALSSFAGAPKVLSLPATATNPRNGEGDFARLRDGRILLVYTEYVGASNDDHATAHLVGRYSSDAGRTWTDRRTVDAEIEKGFFCYFATLVEGNDLLLLTYCRPHLNDACVYRIPGAFDRP